MATPMEADMLIRFFNLSRDTNCSGSSEPDQLQWHRMCVKVSQITVRVLQQSALASKN